MKELNVAFPDNDTGYGTMARNVIRGILRHNVRCKYYDMHVVWPRISINPDIEIMRRMNVHSHSPWLIFFIPRKNLWKNLADNKIDVKYGIKPLIFWSTVWESDRLPYSWKYLLRDAYNIITPSEHSASLFKKDFDRDVWVVPNPVDTNVYHPNGPKKKFEHRVNFFSVFDWQERKDPTTLISSFIEEFGNVDDVALYIRSYGTYMRNPLNAFVNTKRRLLREKNKKFANIFFIRQHLSVEELASFYRSADAFVLPTRCEGFCNPALESMACGTIPIITGWSGHLDFCNEKNSLLIRYHLEPISPKFLAKDIIFDNGYSMENPDFLPWYDESMMWAQASEDHLRKLMREIYDGKHRKKRQSCIDTAKKFDIMTCAGKYIKVMEDNI